jgi:hypothetical protein
MRTTVGRDPLPNVASVPQRVGAKGAVGGPDSTFFSRMLCGNFAICRCSPRPIRFNDTLATAVGGI